MATSDRDINQLLSQNRRAVGNDDVAAARASNIALTDLNRDVETAAGVEDLSALRANQISFGGSSDFDSILDSLEAGGSDQVSTGEINEDPFDQELFDELITKVNVDSSASSAFMKKFSETTEFTESAGNYLTRKFSDSWLSGRLFAENVETGEVEFYMSPNEYYGQDVTKLSENEMREVINTKKAETIDEYYGNVTTAGSPLAGAAGTISGYLVDPTTLIPLGATYKGAAALGAGVGASDVAMEQLARDGEVVATDVALGAVLGGTLGPVVKYAGDDFMPWLKDVIAKGEPISGEDILKQVPKEFVNSGEVTLDSAQRLSEALSASLDLTPKEYLSHSVASVNDLLGGSERATRRSAEEALFSERLATIAQDSVDPKETTKIINNELSFRDKFGDDGFLSAAKIEIDVNRTVKDAIKPTDKKVKLETPEQAEAKSAKEATFREEKIVNSFKEFAKRTGQTGEIAPWLMRDLGLSAAGGLYGYTSSGGDLDSAAMWAIGTGGIAHGVGAIGPKLYNKLGKLKPYSFQVNDEVADNWGRKYMSYAWAERPGEFFKNVAGDTGHKFVNLLERMNEDIRGRMSEDLIDVDQAMVKFGIERGSNNYKGVTDILRDPKKAKMYPKNVQDGAKFVRNKLNSIVKDAMSRGIIKPAVGQQMLKDTITKGYFPRVYDKFKLATNEGKELWHKTLKDHKWSKSQVEIAAKSILGEKKVNFKRFAQVKSKTGEPRYTVDNKFIADLYRSNSKATFSNRSSHLEKERKIALPDEVLEPFLINDLHDVLGSYFHDTQKRIQAAKYFGAADQGMHEIIREMKKKGLTKLETDAAWDVFWTSVGDPKSNSIRQMIEMPQGLRNLYSRASSLQTAKLIFAQTLNMTQATANSLIYLPSRAGVKSPSILLKGIGRTFKRENREWAERIGAAAESTILEVAGEMGSLESKMATKFLKWTGFTAVEKLQRQMAANIGKAYVEELLDTKTKMFAKARRQGQSAASKKKLLEINRKLNEMGINPNLSPNSVPVEQMNRAGQRFSNTINFVNTAEKMPLAWQSPHMKVFRQFKTFMFHQGAFLRDNLLKPLKKGDIRPIIGLAAAGGLGMGPSEVRKWIKSDDEDYTMTERYLQGFAAIGSLGLMYDLAQQAAHGEGRMASAVLGPTFGDIASITKGVTQTGQSILEGDPDFKPIGRSAVNLPLIGQALDVSGSVKVIGSAIGAEDIVEDLPTRKTIKEELSAKKKNPYSYYSNLYK